MIACLYKSIDRENVYIIIRSSIFIIPSLVIFIAAKIWDWFCYLNDEL